MSKERPWPTALSSLVITLSGDEPKASQAIRWISGHDNLVAGQPEGRYLPVVLQGADARPIHKWLESLPGVEYVDVAFCSTEPFPINELPTT